MVHEFGESHSTLAILAEREGRTWLTIAGLSHSSRYQRRHPMPPLPDAMILMLAPFAPLFSRWPFHAHLVLMGAMLVPGARPRTAARRVLGWASARQFTHNQLSVSGFQRRIMTISVALISGVTLL
jgi:hypothetical protein